MTLLQTIILAIVEGITEFLPISSTGHMIIAQKMMGIADSEFTKAFIVNIQFGAILSVVILYWKKFFQSIDFYVRLFVAFIPAAILGFLFSDKIDALLENALTIGIALLVGGVILLFIDKLIHERSLEKPNYRSAFSIGLFQCLAMIPGVSRSAATIVGGLTQGLNRKAAAEFSFFLAVPTMFGASVLKLKDAYETVPDFFNGENLKLLLIGNAVAFVVAMLAIKSFIGILKNKGFKVFGYYRIVVGAIIIALVAMNIPLAI